MDNLRKILVGFLLVTGAAGVLLLGLVDLSPYLSPQEPAPPSGVTRPSNTEALPSTTPSRPDTPVRAEGPSVSPEGGFAPPLPVADEKTVAPAETPPKAPSDPGEGPPKPPPERESPAEQPPADPFAAKAPAKNPPSRAEVGPPRYPWSILLASFKSRERADRALEIYRDRGTPAYWVRVDLQEKGVWFRVFTGHFPSKEAANVFLKEKGFEGARAKPTRFAALVGAFGPDEATGGIEKRLLSLGWCPYIIDGKDGLRRLYAGAFYTEEGAEEVCVELRSRGVQCRAVKR